MCNNNNSNNDDNHNNFFVVIKVWINPKCTNCTSFAPSFSVPCRVYYWSTVIIRENDFRGKQTF